MSVFFACVQPYTQLNNCSREAATPWLPLTTTSACTSPFLIFPASATKAWQQADEAINQSSEASLPSFQQAHTWQNAINAYRRHTLLLPWRNNTPEAETGRSPEPRRTPTSGKRRLRKEWWNHRNELRTKFHAIHRRIKRLSAHLKATLAENK